MGGVAGHLSHIHENLDFTFGEIKAILRDVAQAKIEAVEKVDGQNIFFTYHAGTGTIRTARNSGDIERGGMSPKEFANKWKGHPAESAFMNGFRAIKKAIDELDENTLLDIFGSSGENWVNAEVMYSGNPNVINYNADWIVLHNMQTFDETGEISQNSSAFQQLVSSIDNAETELDKEKFRISGPRMVELQDISDGLAYEDFVNELDGATGMSDDATIGDFVEEQLLSGPVGSLELPIHQQKQLIAMILDKKGAPSLNDFKKKIPKDQHKLVSTLATSTNRWKIIAKMTLPIEKAISNFAIEVLRGMKSFFVSDHDTEITRMRKDLEDSIKKIRSAQDEDAERLSNMLDKQLSKLGSLENIASSMEGIIFEYPPNSRQLYKLTGSFAMVNQIVGRARRMSSTNEQGD